MGEQAAQQGLKRPSKPHLMHKGDHGEDERQRQAGTDNCVHRHISVLRVLCRVRNGCAFRCTAGTRLNLYRAAKTGEQRARPLTGSAERQSRRLQLTVPCPLVELLPGIL